MKLMELSEQYRESGLACRKRAAELRAQLGDEDMGETLRIRLLRRISILESMARDALATANYLKNYYGDDENEENKQGRGISGTEKLSEACLGYGETYGLGIRQQSNCRGAYAPSAAACGNVLSAANSHAVYCP